MNGNKRKGFASMTPERRREVTSMGGKKAHALGVAHKFTSEEARAAALLPRRARRVWTPDEAREMGKLGGRPRKDG